MLVSCSPEMLHQERLDTLGPHALTEHPQGRDRFLGPSRGLALGVVNRLRNSDIAQGRAGQGNLKLVRHDGSKISHSTRGSEEPHKPRMSGAPDDIPRGKQEQRWMTIC